MDPSIDQNLNKVVSDIKILQFLGKGSYGKVYKVKNIKTNQIYAAKIIPRSSMISEKAANALQRELCALEEIKDPNVIRLVDCFRTKRNYYIVMDYCNGGDLASYLNGNQSYYHKRVGECIARRIIRQICKGMSGIFQQGYVHRDIKLPNILLHFENSRKRTLKEASVKIGDLGFARLVTPQQWAVSHVGTPLTMAPEIILQGTKYNHQVDVWSIGVITFELLVGFLPFMAEDYHKFRGVVAEGDFKIPEALHLSKYCIQFINRCLQHDPEKRLHFLDLLKHEWFTLSDEQILESVQETNHKADSKWLQISRMAPPSKQELKEENQIILNAKEVFETDLKERKELNLGILQLSAIPSQNEDQQEVPQNECVAAVFDSESDDEEDSQDLSPLQSTLGVKKKIPYY